MGLGHHHRSVRRLAGRARASSCSVESRADEPILPMRLFRAWVFTVCLVLAFIVGFAMMGAMTFLPTFLQYVRGASATAPGCGPCRWWSGLLITSSPGTIVGRTGSTRSSRSPARGDGARICSCCPGWTPDAVLVDGHRTCWCSASASDCACRCSPSSCRARSTTGISAVATSGVTFFRTLGGSFGAAIFGTVYANVLGNSLPSAVISVGLPPREIATPSALHSHPSAQIQPIVNAYAHSIHVVFLAAVPVALIAFVVALFLKQVPLRGTSRAGAADVGDAFGMPEGANSALQLQTAIARLFQRKGREAFVAIRENSGSDLMVADGWCVGQVHVRQSVGADSSLDAIARRIRVPAQVLEPAFHAARDHGYLAGPDDELRLTKSGQLEVNKFIDSARAWLAVELSDWGAA